MFGRKVTRRTPGRFRTRVISHGVDPVLYAHYKHSKIKQDLKDGVALRTETTVNDTRDFGIGRLVCEANWDALIALGHAANDRLLAQELAAQPCAPDSTALQRIVLPSIENGQPAPGLRFGDPRVMALLVGLCHFDHLFAGITNRGLTSLIAALIPGYSSRQATYDLRRLRRKGLIRRVPRRHRYELTSEGRQTAIFFTKTYSRILNPALAELDPRLLPRSPAAHPSRPAGTPSNARSLTRSKRQPSTHDETLRTAIHQDADGAAWFSVDQPSTRIGSFGDPAITDVGLELDP